MQRPGRTKTFGLAAVRDLPSVALNTQRAFVDTLKDRGVMTVRARHRERAHAMLTIAKRHRLNRIQRIASPGLGTDGGRLRRGASAENGSP